MKIFQISELLSLEVLGAEESEGVLHLIFSDWPDSESCAIPILPSEIRPMVAGLVSAAVYLADICPGCVKKHDLVGSEKGELKRRP